MTAFVCIECDSPIKPTTSKCIKDRKIVEFNCPNGHHGEIHLHNRGDGDVAKVDNVELR